MKVWVILYKEKYTKGEVYQIYDICSSEKIAKKRLKEIEEEDNDLVLKIEDWDVREKE